MCNFDGFEVDSNGNAWGDGKAADGEKKVKRKTSLSYAKHPVDGQGLSLTEERLNMLGMVGKEWILIVEGFYWRLVQIAGDKEDEWRGWIVTKKLEAMNAAMIAERCMLDLEQVTVALDVLGRLGYVKFEECEFAVNCGQPVRFELKNIKMGKLASSQISSENLREPADPLEPNIKTIELNINSTDKATEEKCAQNGAVKEIEESVCLNSRAAEESVSVSDSVRSRSESGRLGSERSGRSGRSGGAGSERSEDSACSSGIQSLKEASSGAEPIAQVHPVPGHVANGMLDWEAVVGGRNLLKDCPSCLLDGFDADRNYAVESLVSGMMVWFREMCPVKLKPDEAGGSSRDEDQARADVIACEKWGRLAWEKGGAEGVIEIMVEMQCVCRQWDVSLSHGGIRNVMSVWIARVKRKLRCDEVESLGNEAS